MPHAVIRVEERHRQKLDQFGIIPIRLTYADLAVRCAGYGIVLYQSVRQAERSQVAVGYFAVASLQRVVPDPDSARHCLVLLEDIRPLEHPDGVAGYGGWSEDGHARALAVLRGWKAAADVREITPLQFGAVIALRGQAPFLGAAEQQEELQVPRFCLDRRQIRDRAFRGRVYRAYHGRCAISGVTLLWPNGLCGLIAAHIFPHAKAAYNTVSAGILLAPTWHGHFDNGNLVIDDDYGWSVRIEDSDTERLTDRCLHLPSHSSEWPDLELLRRKRDLFAHA